MKEYSFQIWQDGMKVAGASGTDLDQVRREELHYTFIYEQDGSVTVRRKGYFKEQARI